LAEILGASKWRKGRAADAERQVGNNGHFPAGGKAEMGAKERRKNVESKFQTIQLVDRTENNCGTHLSGASLLLIRNKNPVSSCFICVLLLLRRPMESHNNSHSSVSASPVACTQQLQTNGACVTWTNHEGGKQ